MVSLASPVFEGRSALCATKLPSPTASILEEAARFTAILLLPLRRMTDHTPFAAVPIPPPQASAESAARRKSTPHATLLLWCAVIAAAGMALDSVLPPLPLTLYGRVSVLWALGVASLVLVVARYGRRSVWGRDLSNRASAVVPMVFVAGFTALGTLFVDPDLHKVFDFHNGMALRGILGLLAGLQTTAILNRATWRNSATGLLMVTAHGGVLLVLCAAALDASFGRRGIIKLHAGGESRVFSETMGLSNTLTGGTGLLDATVRLESIRTEYHPRQVYLRLYRDGVLVASHAVHKGAKGRFGDIAFAIMDYLPHASLSRTVSSSSRETGKSAAMVTLKTAEGQHSDWLFAEKGNYGFIRRPDGAVLVRFVRGDAAPDRPAAPELQLDAIKALWRVAGGRTPSPWAPLPDVLDSRIGDVGLRISGFIREAQVENRVQNLSDAPEVPVITLRLEREGLVRDMTLSPLLGAPVKLDERLVLVPAMTEAEPRSFSSRVIVRWPDGQEDAKDIRVNAPLRIGVCRLYQSDFDREDPSFSGFSVNCSPGSWVAKTGMALMIAGLFGAAVVLLRQRRTA